MTRWISPIVLDIGALILIWLGTLLLVIFAIPEAAGVPLLSPIDRAPLLSPITGTPLTTQPDYTPLMRYYAFAIPAMILITLGMGIQGWRCYQADTSKQISTPSVIP